MRKSRVFNVFLISVLLTLIVIIISIFFTRNSYNENYAQFENLLTDRTIANYFSDEKINVNYELNGEYQDFVLSPLCTDCEQPISNMYNSSSMLIVEAPVDICDVEVERCVVYEFDPFGIGAFKQRTFIRSEK